MLEGEKKFKKAFIFGLVLVFILGVLGGAFLVLKSATTQSQLVELSTPASEGKTSDELLDELLTLNRNEDGATDSTAAENRNLTEDFLAIMLAQGNKLSLSPESFNSDDFFISTTLPYLKSNEIQLLPLIPDSALKIVSTSKANSKTYFANIQKDVSLLLSTFNDIFDLNADQIESEETQNKLQNTVVVLGSIFKNLSQTSVPQNLVELHKGVLLTVFSFQKTVEAMASLSSDPLKATLILNEIEDISDFWQQSLADYAKQAQVK